MICIHCGEKFNHRSKFHRKGKIDECGFCVKTDVPRYIGVVDAAAKSGSGLDIFRTPEAIETVKGHLRRANAIGFTANLPLGNPAAKPLAER